MRISLVGAFNLADGYLGAAKALEKLGHTVSFVPAYLYRSEFKNEQTTHIIRDLSIQKPELVLWWRAETLNDKELKLVVKEIPAKHILYSWDDPFQWEIHSELPKKCKVLDAAFSCCVDSLAFYQKNGCTNAYYCPPGFDEEIHYPYIDDNYACDISIVCTNLYDSKITSYRHMDRRHLLETLIKELPNRTIHIYGSDSFAEIFPENYKGWVKFSDSHKVFSNSKINLCTHIRPDGSMYINERVSQILGSGGLLMVDHVKDIEKIIEPDKECLVMDWNPIVVAKQIEDILNNYEKYNDVKITGYQKALNSLTWGSWASTIINNIN